MGGLVKKGEYCNGEGELRSVGGKGEGGKV